MEIAADTSFKHYENKKKTKTSYYIFSKYIKNILSDI